MTPSFISTTREDHVITLSWFILNRNPLHTQPKTGIFSMSGFEKWHEPKDESQVTCPDCRELLKKNDYLMTTLRTLANSSLDGFWEWDLTDPDKEYLSPRFKEILGYQDHEMENSPKSWQAIIHPDDRECVMSHLEHHLRDSNFRYEQLVRYTHKNGQTVWVLCRGVAIRDASGIPVRMVGTHTDVTEIKAAEQRLKESNTKLEKANSARLTFIASVSHDLRTPIAGILGLLKIIQKDKQSAPFQDMITDIEGCSRQLLMLVNDVLDFSRMDGEAELSLTFEPFVLEDIISRTCKQCRMDPRYDHEKVTIVVEEICMPNIVLGDPLRIQQILTNLLTNAIKFTPEGTITIKTRWTIEEEGFIRMMISVVDTGIGIPSGQCEKLFTNFFQADNNAGSVRSSGVGLGLAISMKLAKMMNGTITVESKEGSGSAFRVSIRLRLPADEAGSPTESSRPPNKSPRRPQNKKGRAGRAANDPSPLASSQLKVEGMRVLLVEDNRINGIVLEGFLQPIGVDTTLVKDGWEAVRALQHHSYQLVLLDLHMPYVNGYTTIKFISHHLPQLPVICLTANALESQKKACGMMGFRGFLSKPFEEKDLITIIADYREAPMQGSLMLSVVDREKALKTYPSVIIGSMIDCVADIPPMVSSIEDLYAARHWDKMSDAAHLLKNSVLLFFPISEMTDLIRTIEGKEVVSVETIQLLKVYVRIMVEELQGGVRP